MTFESLPVLLMLSAVILLLLIVGARNFCFILLESSSLMMGVVMFDWIISVMLVLVLWECISFLV